MRHPKTLIYNMPCHPNKPWAYHLWTGSNDAATYNLNLEWWQATADAIRTMLYTPHPDDAWMAQHRHFLERGSRILDSGNTQRPTPQGCPNVLPQAANSSCQVASKEEHPADEPDHDAKMAAQPPPPPPPPPHGAMNTDAASVIMTIMYAARTARFDLLRAVAHLARRSTMWGKLEDRNLRKLVECIHSTYDLRLTGFVGGPTKDLQLVQYSDADFASDRSDAKSTSGLFFSACWPYAILLPGSAFQKARGSFAQYC